jgi:hypothetical protein
MISVELFWFVTFTLFIIQLMLLKYLCNCLNSILILVHLCLLCSIIFTVLKKYIFICQLHYLISFITEDMLPSYTNL